MRRQKRTLKKRKKVSEPTPCGWCFEEWATGHDHIIPFSAGGTNAKANLMPSCRTCNTLAHNKVFDSIEEKRDWIQMQRKRRGL